MNIVTILTDMEWKEITDYLCFYFEDEQIDGGFQLKYNTLRSAQIDTDYLIAHTEITNDKITIENEKVHF